jgi:hypothetical protein
MTEGFLQPLTKKSYLNQKLNPPDIYMVNLRKMLNSPQTLGNMDTAVKQDVQVQHIIAVHKG